MEYTQEITLDLNSNAAYTTVGAKQGDNYTRIIKVNITENGLPWIIPEGVSAYFRFKKPDGNAVVNSVGIDRTNNQLTIALTAQTLAVSGRGYADIVLWSGQTLLSTISFIIIIMSAPSVVNEVVSSNEFGLLKDILGDADNTINEAEAWARGTRGGIDVVSETSFIYNKQSEVIRSVTVTQSTFYNIVGHAPGTYRKYVFTYTVDENWKLIVITQDGINVVTSDPELIYSLDEYGITYILETGVPNPNPNDTIIVEIREQDITYHENARYYAENAQNSYESIKQLEVDGESFEAPDFDIEESYSTNDYVWYGDKLYQFITDHAPGEWNSEEVIDGITVVKNFINKPFDSSITPSVFSENDSYEQGDYVSYNNVVYRFIERHLPGRWNENQVIIPEVINFDFKLPRGRRGDIYCATFDIDRDGYLQMYTLENDKLKERTFEINNQGELVFIINNEGGT